MITEIPKDATPEEVKTLLAKKKITKKSLRQFVGKLQRGFDGLTYQKEVRDEWN